MKKILLVLFLLIPITGCKKEEVNNKVVINSEELEVTSAEYKSIKKKLESLDYKNDTCKGKHVTYNFKIGNKEYNYYADFHQMSYKDKCAEFSDESDLKNRLVFRYTDRIMDDIDNVSMQIKEGTLTKEGTTIIITDSNEKPYGYGRSFRIDVKRNNKWEILEYIKREDEVICGFNSIEYNVDENNKLELNQNWTCQYGSLEKGEYRLVKDVCSKDDACNTLKYFSVEFNIK